MIHFLQSSRKKAGLAAARAALEVPRLPAAAALIEMADLSEFFSGDGKRAALLALVTGMGVGNSVQTVSQG